MANRVFDCGVPQNKPADIVAVPTVSEIGVPTNLALVTPVNVPNAATNDRVEKGPQAKLPVNIGIPFNPYNGTVNNY